MMIGYRHPDILASKLPVASKETTSDDTLLRSKFLMTKRSNVMYFKRCRFVLFYCIVVRDEHICLFMRTEMGGVRIYVCITDRRLSCHLVSAVAGV